MKVQWHLETGMSSAGMLTVRHGTNSHDGPATQATGK